MRPSLETLTKMTAFCSNPLSKFNDNALAYAAIMAKVLIGLSNTDAVDGAKAMYIFGDSFADTGNGGSMWAPYGISWPGYPAGRFTDGRNQADYFDNTFQTFRDEIAPPICANLLKDSQSLRGVNFARSGAGITYAYGLRALDSQVDQMEALVEEGVLAKAHLRKSVALVSIDVNDYGSRNAGRIFQEFSEAQELNTTISTVVDGIALNLLRLYGLGVRNIVVSNLVLFACSPLLTGSFTYSRNSTLTTAASLHNSLLQQRVRLLNWQLRGLHVVIVDQTSAFEHLFQHGSDYGFENAMTPCCIGTNSSYSLMCGVNDTEEKPLYSLSEDASKAVLFDVIHPTQAPWKKVIDSYASVPGFTLEGPKIHTWIRKYNV